MSIDDEDPISFGEAFGQNPDGTPYEAEEVEVEDDGDADLSASPLEEAEPEPPPSGEDATGTGGRETAEEKAERLFANKYKSVEELEKGYGEADKKLQQLLAERQQWQRQAQPEPEPEPEEAPRPLFKGDTAEIKTEADLYNWAAADPEAAAMFAMQNHERLDPRQMDDVMNNWIAAQPWKATTTIQAWQTQMLREEFAEQRALADAHVIDQIRDAGIKQAIADQPLLEEHSQELGEYIEANPHLNQMVEGARTAAEVTNALHAIFYMMVGPKLATQVLESQVEARVKAEAAAERKAKREAEAAASASRATSISRNTAPPPGGATDEAYDKRVQQMILDSKR